MRIIDEAQYLADEAQNIVDRLKDKDIPKTAVAQDMGDLMQDYAKLRIEILEADK